MDDDWGVHPTRPLSEWTGTAGTEGTAGTAWIQTLQTWGDAFRDRPWSVLLWGDEGCGKTATLTAMRTAWTSKGETWRVSPRDPPLPLSSSASSAPSDPFEWVAWAQTVGGPRRRVLWIDDVDDCSPTQQQSLRSLLDTTPRVCVWMSCRRPDLVLASLRSRVRTLHLSSPSPSDVRAWIADWEQTHPHIRFEPAARNEWIRRAEHGPVARWGPGLALASTRALTQALTPVSMDDVVSWDATGVPVERVRRHWRAVRCGDRVRALREGVDVEDEGYTWDDWLSGYASWVEHDPSLSPGLRTEVREALGEQAVRGAEGRTSGAAWAWMTAAWIRRWGPTPGPKTKRKRPPLEIAEIA